MRVLIALLLVWLAAQTPQAYSELLQAWQRKVPKEATVSLSQFATTDEMCGPAPCEPFYFLARDSHLASRKETNMTVLLVGGLRGDDATGHTVLFNAYSRLRAATAIFLPLPNPSGLAAASPNTSPANVSIQDDFPVGAAQQCNRSAAVRSLHHLYRTYPIDLTIYLHDAPPALAYSWGRKVEGQLQAEDFGIYADMADMVRYEANDDKDLEPLETGPLYGLKAPVGAENLIDWAYGASKHPEIVNPQCGGQPAPSYPQSMMNGLALSLSIGKLDPTSVEKGVSRAVRILQRILTIINPTLAVTASDKEVSLSLQGCKAGTLTSLKILTELGSPIFEKVSEAIVKGDVTYGSVAASIFPLPQGLTIPSRAVFEATFTCDNGWLNIGSTAFSKTRTFTQTGAVATKGQLSFEGKPGAQVTQLPPSVDIVEQEEEEWGTLKTVSVSFLLLLGAIWLVAGMYLGRKVRASQRIKNFDEKFETVEVVEDTDTFSSNLAEKDEKEEKEAPETKEQLHDGDQARLRAS